MQSYYIILIMNLHEVFLTVKNGLDYPIRQWARWHLPGLSSRNERKDDLFQYLSISRRKNAERKEREFRSRFHLEDLYNHSSCETYRINLYYLDLLLEAYSRLQPVFPDSVTAADIGTSDWFYVQVLQAFYTYWNAENGRTVQLFGYECDAYRIYADYHSRFDHTVSNIREIQNVHFIPKAFFIQNDRFDFISIFFPFIFLQDHLSWGLVKKSFSPRENLLNAWESLKPGGIIVLANQGNAEYERQREIMNELRIPSAGEFQFSSDFYHYPYEHFVTLAQKD